MTGEQLETHFSHLLEDEEEPEQPKEQPAPPIPEPSLTIKEQLAQYQIE